MYILALETTGEHASVALIDENNKIETRIHEGSLSHLQNLTCMVSEMLTNCKMSIDDVDAIAASEGPGSFTGIRIGISTARAIAQAAEKDTIAVPTLKSFIYNCPDFKGIVCPIFDARRSEIYGGAYRASSHGPEEITEGRAYDINEFLEKLGQSLKALSGHKEIRFFGDGIKKYLPQIEEWQKRESEITVSFAGESCREQTAASVARLALEIYKKEGAKGYEQLKPNYMRKAEAERKLEEGTLKIATEIAKRGEESNG